MNETPHFPNDENGQVLRQTYDGGDDLARSRIVDFCFVFPDREQALAFVRDVDDRNVETCWSLCRGKAMWQVMIVRLPPAVLTSINDTASWGTIYADSITIDAAGRSTAENETTPVQPFKAPTAVSATYDADNRLRP
jgi:hypothetical protein